MNAAFIPVRGGSKSIPLKNIKEIAGRPLVYWTVAAACGCDEIGRVYVATDSGIIRDTLEAFKKEAFSGCEKIRVIDRSSETASDTASTESAMLEFAQKYDFENITLIQATSPLLTSEDLIHGFETFFGKDVDSVLSVVRQKRFYWDIDESGYAHPINYDVYNRPRRQEFQGCFMENGAFYITSKAALLNSKNRISGNIKIVEMCEESAYELDEESDWIIIEALMKKRRVFSKKNFVDYKMFLTDCDGCLTDGGMYYSENGDELKKFNAKDGLGFAVLKQHGFIRGIVTGETRQLNRRRAEKLELEIYEEGCQCKLEVVKRLCNTYGISMSQVIYVGDDINDLDVMKNVGLGCCPADASRKIKDAADYVSPVKSGQGAVRDIIEYVISMHYYKK